MTMHPPAYACIEAGGTKFIAGIVRAPDDIVATARFETTTPDRTLPAVICWLKAQAERVRTLAGIGIASFGPLELDRASPGWGRITTTTKPGWSGADIAGAVAAGLGDLPLGFDTDVNGAALAEARWGAAQGQRVAVYVTVGTGIGGGIVVQGTPLLGVSHPEMGHLRPPRHPEDQDFAGICPFHGDCLEGLASGPAISARWGASLAELAADHPAHRITAWYLAQLAVTLQSVFEPGRIVLGGGVGGATGLLDRVRMIAAELGGGYFRGDPRRIIVPPALGERAGLLGALALAMDARDLAPM
jgi:fructokinase